MKLCPECAEPSVRHFESWLERIADVILPPLDFVPHRAQEWAGIALEKCFTIPRIARFDAQFAPADIQMRSVCFVRVACAAGWEVELMKGPFGYTNQFRMRRGKQLVRFEGLPGVQYSACRIDDKLYTKKKLLEAGLPVAPSKAFWLWRERAARAFAERLGFPLVVKPVGGSVARHVTTNIMSEKELHDAIRLALQYAPQYIVERYVKGFVHRATIIGEKVFCVKQAPAFVVGDGAHTVSELVSIKNANPMRGTPGDRAYNIFKLVLNATSGAVLAEQGMTLASIPGAGKRAYVQRNPFLRLGGDLEEVTDRVAPENAKLFRDLGKLFRVGLAGIDFVAQDIQAPWNKQSCAILELNSLPCIEMHHFPTMGAPQNAAQALLEMIGGD